MRCRSNVEDEPIEVACRPVALLTASLDGCLSATPANASGWVAVEGDEDITGNPCTGQETTLVLRAVTMLISGHGNDHQGHQVQRALHHL